MTRSATRANGASIVEQPTRGNAPRMNLPSDVYEEKENVGVENVEEILLNQVFDKMKEIL
jgi:hypothetical protein